MNPGSVIVVGAGIAGLAAAARLAAAGRQVLVLEANAQPGGKLGLLESGGYSWDTGPSLFTQPELFDQLIRDCGRNPDDYLRYRKLSDGTRYFWDDGQRFHASPDRAALLQNATTAFGDGAGNLAAYLNDATRLYRNIGPLFLDQPLHRLRDWNLRAVLKALPAVRPAYLLRTLHGYNESRLQHPRLTQVMDRMATYNGSDPYRCPAMLSMIAQLEFNEGSWYPEGGMISLPRALRRLCEDLGVVFEFGKTVQRLIRNGNSWSVSGSGFRHHAAAVISNLDVAKTYRDLLADKRSAAKTLAAERSSSGLVFYWGMNQTFPELGLHNIFSTTITAPNSGPCFASSASATTRRFTSTSAPSKTLHTRRPAARIGLCLSMRLQRRRTFHRKKLNASGSAFWPGLKKHSGDRSAMLLRFRIP
jgi:phytoene desaturase